MKRAEIVEQLAPVSSVQTRKVDKDPSRKIVITPEMVSLRPGRGKRLLEVEQENVSDLFRFLHMPPDMAGKIRPETRSMVANDLLDRREEFELLMRDGKIIGFRSATNHASHAMSVNRVLDTIEKVVRDPDYNRVIIGDAQGVSLEVVGIDQATVTHGDVMRAGAMVKFSPLGITNPSVQSFVLRLVCTNGLTSTTVLREYSYSGNGGGGGGKSGDNIWSWLRKGLRDAYQSYNQVVEKCQQMASDEIPENQRAMVLEAMIREAGMQDDVRNTVRAMAVDQPIRTAYDVLNLMTYASSHLITDAKHLSRARKATEVFQSQGTHSMFCPVCRKNRGATALHNPPNQLPG